MPLKLSVSVSRCERPEQSALALWQGRDVAVLFLLRNLFDRDINAVDLARKGEIGRAHV